MNFKGHFVGGTLSGIAVGALAILSDKIQIDTGDITRFLESPLVVEGELQTLIGIFLITWFMSLFPDLDTASIPQRWFFRIMLVILATLYFTGHSDLFAVCAFVSILPVIHKHRGWTHWKITPWIIAIFLAVIFEYFRFESSFMSRFSIENVRDSLVTYWIFVLACVVGHYTHLILDSKKIKWLPFIRNNANHH